MRENHRKKRIRRLLAGLLSLCLCMGGLSQSIVTEAANTALKDGQTEEAKDGQLYHVDILVEAEYEYTLTFGKNNIEADHADIVIEKNWNVAAGTTVPDEITVTVTQKTGTSEVELSPVTLSAADGWTATLANMPLYDDDGTKITYSIEEDDVSTAGEYYGTIVTEVISSVTEKSADKIVYTEGDKTITFYFDSTAPHININGIAYTSNTSNWKRNSDGTYSLTFTYINPDTRLTYTSTWVYNPTTEEYTYISDDYMVVDDILYVTYTDLNGNAKILYDKNEYVDWSSTTTRDAGDNHVARNYYYYIEQADTNRADQEFWSTNRAIEDMPAGTTIRVGYKYTYGYYDKFGDWYSFSDNAEQVFDTASSSFSNVCGDRSAGDTKRGYDVVLQLTDDYYYLGDGLKETYDVDITNTPVSSLAISKTVSNAGEMPDANQQFTFTVTLDDFLGGKISDTFDAVVTNGLTVGNTRVAFTNGVATVTLKAGDTLTINGLPEGVGYTIKENLPENYTAAKETITGKVDGSTVSFVNTYVNPVKHGNLVIEKDVKHPFGTSYVMPDKEFTVQVTLKDKTGAAVANTSFDAVKGLSDGTQTSFKVTTNAKGVFTVTLKHGEQVTVSDLEEGVKAVVQEINVPAGFAATYQSRSEVTIAADSTSEVAVVNTYTPAAAEVKIDISGTKKVNGSWPSDVEFTFYLQKYVNNTWITIASDKATANDPDIDFMDGDSLTFDAVGTYAYRVIEANHGLTINGITYDSTIHTFDVIVTDKDMDGTLEAEIVSSHDGASGFAYDAATNTWVNNHIDFTNTISRGKGSFEIAIQKDLNNPSGSDKVDLEGYYFELYETDSSYNVAQGQLR